MTGETWTVHLGSAIPIEIFQEIMKENNTETSEGLYRDIL